MCTNEQQFLFQALPFPLQPIPKETAPLQPNEENVGTLLPSSEKIATVSVGTATEEATSHQNTEQVHISLV